MARIRTVKPEFWTDATLGECSPTARLLFIGTWSQADDYGNLERAARQLKAQIFPYDSIDVEPLLQELICASVLIEYRAGGKNYLHIKGFSRHQRIERRSNPRYPIYEESESTHGALDEPSGNMSSEGNLEGKGTGTGTGTDTAADSLGDAKQSQHASGNVRAARGTNGHAELDRLKAIYPKRAGSNPWDRAERAAHARIRDGCTWQQIIDGARRYAEFIRATGKERTEFVMQAATFCGPSKHFLEPWDLPATKADAAQEANVRAGRAWLRGSA